MSDGVNEENMDSPLDLFSWLDRPDSDYELLSIRAPFGLSQQQRAVLHNMDTFRQPPLLFRIVKGYYITLPRPERLPVSQDPPTWKMDIFVPLDASPVNNPRFLTIYYTLWDESLGRAFACPGTLSSAVEESSVSPMFFKDGEIDCDQTMEWLGAIGIPDTFGKGKFSLHPDPEESADYIKAATFLRSLLSAPHFKPHKLLVHDSALADALYAMQRRNLTGRNACTIPNFEAINISSLVKTPKSEGDLARCFLTVCSMCKIMGGYAKKAAEVRFMQRCAGCGTSYYRSCQQKDWPRHKLQCKSRN